MFDYLQRLPGVREVASAITGAERIVIQALEWHICLLDPSADPPPAPNPPEPDPSPNVAVAMQTLLLRALNDSPIESRTAIHEALISSLVPDEARILSALSDGSRYPLIHVSHPGIGGNRKYALYNASSVGRAAGVALPDRTPTYVTRLRQLGLVETGDEDTGLRSEYEILLVDPGVREAMKAVAKGPLAARVVRETLVMSDLGRELWEAAR